MTLRWARRAEGSAPRTRLYTWFLLMVVAAGVAASLSTSYMLYRVAERQWIARAESDAQRFSSMLLDWVDESYAPLSGLAALVETSRKTEAREFLNAFDGIESRSTTVLRGVAAMLERDGKSRWMLVISSGNFQLLESEAATGFSRMAPLHLSSKRGPVPLLQRVTVRRRRKGPSVLAQRSERRLANQLLRDHDDLA